MEKEIIEAQGTTCRVRIDSEKGFVRKYPRLISAVDLAERLEEYRKLALAFFAKEINETDAERLAPKCELAENGELHLRQRLVRGRPLGYLSNSEIDGLPEKEKVNLIQILTHYLIAEKCCPHLAPDIFGFDERFSGLERILRTLDPRNSTNIWVTDDSEISMIDLDQYHRPERPLPKRMAAKILTPLMVMHTEIFRRNILATVTGNKSSIPEQFFLASVKYGDPDRLLEGVKITRPEDLIKLKQLLILDGAIKNIGEKSTELERIVDGLRPRKDALFERTTQKMDKPASYEADKLMVEYKKTASSLMASMKISHEIMSLISEEEWEAMAARHPSLSPAIKRLKNGKFLLSTSRVYEILRNSVNLQIELINFSVGKFVGQEIPCNLL